ncbi:MGDG synthase family glycosyltransferase [Paenibacillus rigui]|uniref:Galactosyldiacylglycerol synthase n=1 Tax=Paenibacillus rigui TaxID=554312 RepID=A0A229UWW9_9BACL|nr:glycosyltransferase [Paenibacillus rigui]OXM87997.1 galactosyldiacylglycerol synthase [Paenibacillus rigui]
MSNVNPRVLILTASYGNGHIQASQAIQQQFIKQGVDQVSVIDLMKEGHPFLNKITTSLYKKSPQSSRIGLDYYGWSYYLTRETKHTALFNRSMQALGRKKLTEVIHQIRPDAVVNAFPFGAAPEVCSTLGIQNFTVITDYALHSTWIHPYVDKYYVATDDLKEDIISKGFAKDRVKVSGIPIRKDFDELSSGRAASVKQAHKKTVLVMAADSGAVSYIEEMLQVLLFMGEYRVVVVCGRNEKLKQRLEIQFAAYFNLEVLGYIENIHELMSLSSCIITKAGGLTLTEAIALRLPIFIYRPYAGQERENALYLTSRGVASMSNNVEELSAQIRFVLSNPGLIEAIKSRMVSLQRKHASALIVSDIIQSIDQQVPVSM